MITGRTLDSREAVIRVRVFGVGNGIIHEVQAIVDTGFTEALTLPSDIIELLELPFQGNVQNRQSDGNIVDSRVYLGEIEWDGKRIAVEVQASETETLVGMGLIWGYTLTVRGAVDGLVSLEAIGDEGATP